MRFKRISRGALCAAALMAGSAAAATEGAPAATSLRAPLLIESHAVVDVSKGVDAPATFTLTGVSRGDAAAALRTLHASLSPEMFRAAMVQSLTRRLERFEVAEVDVRSEPDGAFTVTLTGQAPLNWQVDAQTGMREYAWPESLVAITLPARRPLDGAAQQLEKMSMPADVLLTVTFVTPEGGKGFAALGPRANEAVEGAAVRCDEAAEAGRFTFRCMTQSPDTLPRAAASPDGARRVRELTAQRAVLRRAAD